MAKFEQGILVLYGPLGHASETVSTSAVPLPDLPDVHRVRRVVIRTVDQPVNYRDDGTPPTDSTGMYLASGEVLVYDGDDPAAVELILAADATGDADVRVAYYGT